MQDLATPEELLAQMATQTQNFAQAKSNRQAIDGRYTYWWCMVSHTASPATESFRTFGHFGY